MENVVTATVAIKRRLFNWRKLSTINQGALCVPYENITFKTEIL